MPAPPTDSPARVLPAKAEDPRSAAMRESGRRPKSSSKQRWGYLTGQTTLEFCRT